MKTIIKVIIILWSTQLFSQEKIDFKNETGFKINFSAGLYTDLFYASLLSPKDDDYNSPASYPNLEQSKIKLGLIKKLELSYQFKSNNTITIAYNHASWRDLYGLENDPLEVWKSFKRFKRRTQFSLNYLNRIVNRDKSTLDLGIGFMIQIEQFNNNAYSIRNNEIYFNQNNKSFIDPVFPVNLQYLYRVNANLGLGLNFFTGYTYQVGIENAAIMPVIAIDLNKKLFRNKTL
jgi:hypothetical protein